MKISLYTLLTFSSLLQNGIGSLQGNLISSSLLKKSKNINDNKMHRYKRDQIVSWSSVRNETEPFSSSPKEQDEEYPPPLASFSSLLLVQNPLNYAQDIQPKIDVSRPYYALRNERVLRNKNSKSVQGITCNVLAEMPHGSEGGTLTAAEAARHMAIAGSIASAMVQPKDGKFYYLALDAKISRKPFTGFASAVQSVDGYASILATCTDMGGSKPRSCSSEILLETSPNEDAWFLQVSYAMVPQKLFRKLYGEVHVDTILRMQEAAESPYINFSGSPNVTRLKTGTRTDSSITCYTHFPPPRPEDCLGHFETNPALPIAFTCSLFSDLIAQTISELCGVPTVFRARGKNVSANAATFVCQEFSIKAEELVFANTFGQHVECDVELLSGDDVPTGGTAGKFFRAIIRALKDDEYGKVIFRGESVWKLVSASN